MTDKKFVIKTVVGTLVPVIILAGIGIVVYTQYQKAKEKPVLPEADTPIVRTFTVSATSDNDIRSFPGFAKESRRTKAAFRVPGPLCELNAILGSTVEQGGVLAKIDPRDFQLAVQRLESSLAEAQAMYAAMKTGARVEDVEALKAQLTAAKSAEETAKTQYERMQNLLESQTASKAQFDKAKMDYDVAKGAREALEMQLEKATAGARPEEIAAMEAKIAGIKTSLTTANNALADTILKAPFDGFIVQKFVENHEIVAPGQAIVELSDARQIEVSISIPESILVRENDFAQDLFTCSFEAYPDRQFPASIKEIGQSIQLGRQSYPMTLTVKLPPADDANAVVIRPNMAATVTLALKRNNPYFIIPQGCLIAPNGKSGSEAEAKGAFSSADVLVFNPADSCVHATRVTFNKIRPGGVEIVSGLKPGDIIVSAGARFLEDGQKVKLESAAEQKTAADGQEK